MLNLVFQGIIIWCILYVVIVEVLVSGLYEKMFVLQYVDYVDEGMVFYGIFLDQYVFSNKGLVESSWDEFIYK